MNDGFALVELRWMLCPFIELFPLPLLLLLLLFRLLQMVFAQFHEALEFAIGLEHTDPFDHSVLLALLLLAFRGRRCSWLGGLGCRCDSDQRVCHPVFVLGWGDCLLHLSDSLLHGHVLSFVG